MKEAVFATGIPFAAVAPQRRLAFARTLGVLMPQVAGIRRFGAAALDLAWVAAGRYDGYLGARAEAAGTWPPACCWCARPAASSPTRRAAIRATPATWSPPTPHLHAPLREAVSEGVGAASRAREPA